MIETSLHPGQLTLDSRVGMDEEWRSIPGSEGYYSVSSWGRVRSEPLGNGGPGRQRGRVLRCNPDSKGYPQFAMCLPEGRRIQMKVHRAVALVFIGPRPSGAQINHISGDKNDNRPGNLEYVSCGRNVRHAWALGLRRSEQVRGENHGCAKLTEVQVREIRSSNEKMSVLADQFGVTPQCIDAVQKHKTWRHVA